MSRRHGRVRLCALAVGSALVGALSLAPTATGAPSAAQGPEPCPAPMPVDELRARLSGASGSVVGTGYTVARGTQPGAFDAEFLGVLDNGILPGRDLVIAELRSAALDSARGVWAGMSGSPVYLDGKLVGAVAYSLSFGPSRIAGITPAEYMMRLLDRPDPAATTAGRMQPAKVHISSAMRARIASATGVSADEVGDGLVRLRVPVSVSGLAVGGTRALRHLFRREGVRAIPFNGSSVSPSSTGSGASLEPGGNFAAALSYGDVTIAGVGTTTAVCGDKAIAFGHPFFFGGETLMGANEATAITVVDDPTFGPYKLANVGAIVGRVDQDRLAGIRAQLDANVSSIPVHTTVASEETGQVDESETRIVWDEDVTHLSLDHLFYSILVATDEFDEGSSRMRWTISGTTESGNAWELNRWNRYTSRYGLPWDTIEEYHWQMHRIDANRFEPVEYTGIDADISVTEQVRKLTIVGVRAAVGDGRFRDVRRVRVRPGQRIRLRVTLEPYDGTSDLVRTLSVRVPRAARRGGELVVSGGTPCFTRCSTARGATSFAGFIAAEERQPHTSDLIAQLRLGRGAGPDASGKVALRQAIARSKTIAVVVRGGRARTK
ncbi:MAG TPA: SpoIVB peptidase S55 domain-containing protein [Actinomycetota bacterium]|nr:SpoIVB peptidase S55 domain-containing protein [Actinomycetota bacterium]